MYIQTMVIAIVHVQVVKMITFVLYIFYHDKKNFKVITQKRLST